MQSNSLFPIGLGVMIFGYLMVLLVMGVFLGPDVAYFIMGLTGAVGLIVLGWLIVVNS